MCSRKIAWLGLALWLLLGSSLHSSTVWAGEPVTTIDVPVALDTQSTVPAADLEGCGGARLPSSNPDFEAEVVRLVNQIRLDNGLMPLKRVSMLDDASRFHATDMSVDNYFSHTSHDRVDGQLVESCEWGDRLRVYYSDWTSIAENIAAGYATPQSVVDAWMNSPGHRRNVLSENNWEIGVGYFNGEGSYHHYWVQDFGRRHEVYPLVVDGEAASTETGEVTLHIYGQWQDVRLRTDDEAWSDWQPFASACNGRSTVLLASTRSTLRCATATRLSRPRIPLC